MKPTLRPCRGYSLIELLVVLVIVGILAMVGVTMIGNRTTNAVRSVLDEVEGVLSAAQKGTIASSRDIYVCSSGDWLAGSLVLDGRPLRPTVANPPGVGDLNPGDDLKRVGSASEVFRSHATSDRDHMSAGVAVDTAPWYGVALGTTPALATVAPISGQTEFTAALGNPLFKSSGLYTVIINGQTKRFMTGFCVVVVGLASGNPLPNGPVGVLIVPQNSSNIYKYYKADQSSVWRKI